jgi:hypothetical protein
MECTEAGVWLENAAEERIAEGGNRGESSYPASKNTNRESTLTG